MLIVAGGAEELHTAEATAIGPWVSAAGVEIETGTKYTGAACFKFGAVAAGTSQSQADQTKGWWSYALTFTLWGDGSYRHMFQLCGNDDGRYIGFVPGVDVDNSYVALFKGTTGTVLAQGTHNCGKSPLWSLIKLEFDNGHWTCWIKPFGGVWAEEFTFDDSGAFTTMDNLLMSLNSSGDEEKGESYAIPYADDCHCWDAQGDNWNSRLSGSGGGDANADFPRISVAHMPTANGEWDDLDEIPPDHASKPDADDENAYYDVEALKEEPEDYTAETIQAVMVTRCDGSVSGGQAEFDKFNLYDGDTLHADSGEDGRMVQFGRNGLGDTKWWTVAGYYPWTPDEENWTEELFNTCEYGCHVLTAYTDQVTAQVIFFGSSHEWSPTPAGGAVLKISTIEWASVKKVSSIVEASVSKVSTIEAN